MTEGASDAPTDPGLPIVALDRGLAPIRRVVAFGLDHPEQVRYFEANATRWLDPLLVLELPAPVRELLVAVAGQVSGFDALDSDGRKGRLSRLRQAVMRLDALLGLPLPAKERYARIQEKQPGEDVAKHDDERDDEEDGSGGRSSKKRKSRGRRSRRKRGKKNRDDPKGSGESRERPRKSRRDNAPRGSSFWNGNPWMSLSELEIEPGLVERLAAVGVQTVHDLLRRPPRTVETHKPIHGAGRELPEGRIAVGGRLKSTWSVCKADGTRHIHARIVGAGPITLTWEDARQARWWLDGVTSDDRVVVVGTWTGETLTDPEVVFDAGKSVRLPRFGLDGVPDARIQALLFRLMPSVKQVRDPVAHTYRNAHVGLSEAIEALHGLGDGEAGRQRLAYDEALVVGLAGGWSRYGGGKVRGVSHALVHTRLDRLLQGADARLDDRQQLAFDEIKRDLRRARPMRRLLVGGPGGGKGLVALLTAVMVGESKCQVLWLSSNARDAETRFTWSERLLKEAGVVGRIAPNKPNRGLRDALKRGEIHVLFGTPELLEHDLDFRRLGLVISSEAEQFGAVSDAVDTLKNPRPDLLVVPDAPPQLSVFLSAWPDHEVTVLQGAEPPDVVVKSSANRVSAYATARHAIVEGGQVAVLFPLINGTDALDPAEAHRLIRALGEEALSGARITLLHGAMPRDERQRVLSDFIHRRSDVLVATAPLEDASPIPGLETAVVEHAHRMDITRLRRIAGLGVGKVTLVVDEGTEEARQDELKALVQLSNSALPESMRDADEPALPGFRFLDPARDAVRLLRARNAALAILAADSGLRSGQSVDLLRAAHAFWPELFGDVPCPLPKPGDSSKRRRRRRRRK